MKLTWNLIGKFLGYPDCCVEHFEQNAGCQPEECYKAANGTGFVPCPHHAKQVISGRKKLNDLIKNRSFSVPFPAEGSPDQLIDECRSHYESV